MIIDMRNTNMTLEEALFIAKPYDVIYLDNRIYYEKIKVTKPYITLIGQEFTKITFDAYNSKIIPLELGGDGIKKYGTSGSATFTVSSEAHHFKCSNIIFENSHVKVIDSKGAQAVAFKGETFNIEIDNCKFYSYQDTLYLDYGTNNIIKNSYIEGDVDFIFGSADCVLENCHIHAKKVNSEAYYTAPSTLIINDKGLVFNGCSFTADKDLKVYLGRAWHPSGAPQPVYPRVSFINSTFEGDIDLALIKMHDGDPNHKEIIINNCFLNNEKIKKE